MKSKTRVFFLAVLPLLASTIAGAKRQQGVGEQGRGGREREAQLAEFVDLEYPGIARETRVQGIVIVKAEIDDRGSVVDAVSLSNMAKPLVAASLANVKKWKFKPHSGTFALIVYEFRLTVGACHDASHSLFELAYPNFAKVTACSHIINGEPAGHN